MSLVRRVLLACLATVCFASSLARADLAADVRAVLNDKYLSKAKAGVAIAKLTEGSDKADIIFASNAKTPLIPASNLKLITTAAALDRFGPDFKFRTHLLLKGEDLYLVGDGDPTLGDAEMLKPLGWDVTTIFNIWADELKKKNITSVKNLFVCPATIDLAGAEIELVPAFSRELKLKRALQGARDDYDFTLIDCPPSLGLLTVNGLAAADDVIVPIQCEYYALEGLSQLIRNVTLVRTNLNPKLDVRGIVLTMYDARTKLADQVEQEVREHFGPRVYQTVVPRTVRLSEAPSFGQPIIVFDSTSRGAVAYRELAKEVSSGATRRSG